MSTQTSKKITAKAVALHTDDATLVAPTAAPSADTFTTWRSGGPQRFTAITIVKGSGAAAGAQTIAAGAKYYGHPIGSAAAVYVVAGDVNGGNEVALGDNLGFEEVLEHAAGAFDDLKIVGTASDEVTVTATPLESTK